MKMFTVKNVLKLTTGVIAACVLSSQAFAADIALKGTYGNYLQPGCSWNFTSSNTYGPTSGVPNGARTNGVQVTIHQLLCNGNPAPQVVKVDVVHFTFTMPYWNIRSETSRTCHLSAAQALFEGDCVNHRIYN